MALPWSWTYSQQDAFLSCAYRYYRTKVLRDIVEPPTEHTVWGQKVHTALENRVKDGTPLPDGMTHWEPLVAKIVALPGEKLVETKLAVDSAFQPTEWSGSWCRGIADLLIVDGDKAAVLDWKGLPTSTEIPTPSGFKTMGDLAVGDYVFGGDGKPCTVVGKSRTNVRACFNILFDDGTDVVCDDQHLWSLHDGKVVPIKELKRGDKIALAGAAQYPDKDLPIDPYVFGFWLADGKHTSGEISKPDQFMWDEVGGNLSAVSRCPSRTVKKIRGKLAALGVLGNKHVPTIYLTASVKQRIDLLRGLMDGDGSANPTRKQAVFTTTDFRLSCQVKELLESLGQRVNQAITTQRGFGKVVKAYTLAFRPQNLNPFLLPRKAERIDAGWGVGNSWYRKVVSIKEVEERETVCIAVDSSDNTYLCTRNYLRTHNTGKKKPSDQLALYAAKVFSHYPDVKVVDTRFVWLREKKLTPEKFTRKDIPIIWNKFLPTIKRMEIANETGNWKKNPTGLCRGWCPVKDCQFWKNGK